MNRYVRQLADALDAVAIRGPLSYTWLGRSGRAVPSSVRVELDPAACRAHVHESISQELYWSFYCRGEVVPARWGELQPIAADPRLVRALADANAGDDSWESGWTVERMAGDEAVLRSARFRVRAPVAACFTGDHALEPGRRASVRLPREFLSLSPGFVALTGGSAEGFDDGVVRVYWNIVATSAAALTRAVTRRLTAHGVPYRFKVAAHPLRFDRCDAAVLYVSAESFPASRELIAAIAADVAAGLKAATPAFTLEFAPGVGLAEDAGEGESFGVRRCALLADGVLDAHASSARGTRRLDVVIEHFAAAGVDISAPYRHPALAGGHVL